MSSFEGLGLRAELLRVLADEELERPTAVQEAVIPTIRRGGNQIARASTGSGKTLAYALGVLDRLKTEDDADSALRFLVLVPTREEADRIALSLFPYVQAIGLSVTVPGGSWGTPANEAEVLVTPVADILEGVRGSATKFDQLEAVVIDGASTIHAMGDLERADALMDLVPRDAQRIVVTTSIPSEVEDLIERRVKRALRYPPEPAISEGRTPSPEGSLGYVLVSEGEKLDVLARQLTQSRGAESLPPIIFCRTDDRAAEIAEQLSVRGFVVGAADDLEVDVAVAAADTTRAELLEESEGELGQTISYDVPPDLGLFRARHGDDFDAVVMVEPRELPHVRDLARMANLLVKPLPLPVDTAAGGAELAAFRRQLREAIEGEDLTAQMLVLAPLFDEFGALEVAAAAAALLRRKAPPAPSAAPADRGVAPSLASTANAGVETGPAPKPFTRLYVGIGSRDDIRPGDLVGALAGESDIKGNQIGKIEIRDSFSVVEVQADVADKVIRAVNGTTIKGRSVRVDYDRAANRAKRPPERRQGNRPDSKDRVVRRPPREE